MEQRPELRDASAAELQRRLKKSVDRFSEVSSKQADVMIGLTKRISGLTVAILVLTVVLAVVEVVGCLAD